jgi:capsular polysaccharide biosynthesis protein
MVSWAERTPSARRRPFARKGHRYSDEPSVTSGHMELRRYLATLSRHLRLVGITVAVALMVAWLLTPNSNVYVAKTTLYVGQRSFDTNSNQPLSVDRLAALDRVSSTFASMIDSYPIAQDALEATHLPRSVDDVVAATTAVPRFGTQLLEIRVQDPDPQVAQQLADGLAAALVSKVQTFEPTVQATEGDVPSLPAYIFARARLPRQPEPTSRLKNLMLGGMFGLLAGGAIVFLIDYLDITIRSAHDAERRVGLPVLGVIPTGQVDRLQRHASRRTNAPPDGHQETIPAMADAR